MQRRSIPIHELVCVLDSDKVTALSFFMPFMAVTILLRLHIKERSLCRMHESVP